MSSIKPQEDDISYINNIVENLNNDPLLFYPLTLGKMNVSDDIQATLDILSSASYTYDENEEVVFDHEIYASHLENLYISLYSDFNLFFQVIAGKELFSYTGALHANEQAEELTDIVKTAVGQKIIITAFLRKSYPQLSLENLINSFSINAILQMYNLLPDHLKEFMAPAVEYALNKMYPGVPELNRRLDVSV
jgi:hypothetical protein